jgi:uncharacterized protein DUF6459
MPALPPTRPGCTTVRRARPLPDPAAVRLCLIPDPAPPFDGEAPGGEGTAAAGEMPPAGPGTSVPPEDAASCDAAGGGSAGGGAEERAGHDVAAASGAGRARRPGSAGQAPRAAGAAGRPANAWPGRFAQVLAETLGGSRHPRQLVPWTTAQARDHIQRLGPQLSSPQQPRVRRVVTFSPTTDAMEMSVIVGFGSRVRALAVRLERQPPPLATPAGGGAPPRWLCTAVEAA